jgi:hypothetical protein
MYKIIKRNTSTHLFVILFNHTVSVWGYIASNDLMIVEWWIRIGKDMNRSGPNQLPGIVLAFP